MVINTFDKMKETISALKEFNNKINDAIKDEQEAQRKYDIMIKQAGKASIKIGIRNVDSLNTDRSGEIRGILGQEHEHERKLNIMLKNTDLTINYIEDDLKRLMAEEQRRVENEHKKSQVAKSYGRR